MHFLAHTLGNPFTSMRSWRSRKNISCGLSKIIAMHSAVRIKAGIRAHSDIFQLYRFIRRTILLREKAGLFWRMTISLQNSFELSETGAGTATVQAERIIRAEKDFPSSSEHCLLGTTISTFIRKSAIILKWPTSGSCRCGAMDKLRNFVPGAEKFSTLQSDIPKTWAILYFTRSNKRFRSGMVYVYRNGKEIRAI